MSAHSLPENDPRVSTLELFFDLVFVFIITQLAFQLEEHFTLEALAHAGLLFVVLYWMYSGYAWLTNRVAPDTTGRRVGLIAGMGAFMTCALSIPQAFAGGGVAFAAGYFLVVLVHAALYARSYPRSVRRFVPLNLLAAVLLFAAAFFEGGVRWFFWIGTLVLHYAAARLSGGVEDSGDGGLGLRAPHFVERHGLLLIVAFGETIVATGIAIRGLEMSFAMYGAAVLGLVLAALLWATHFLGDPDRSEHVLARATVPERVRLALSGYFYAYLPLLFGMVMLATGLSHAVAHIGAPLPWSHAIPLGAGPALYLLGTVLFRSAFAIRPVTLRLLLVVGALATIALGATVSALVQLLALIAGTSALLLAERASGARRTRRG